MGSVIALAMLGLLIFLLGKKMTMKGKGKGKEDDEPSMVGGPDTQAMPWGLHNGIRLVRGNSKGRRHSWVYAKDRLSV